MRDQQVAKLAAVKAARDDAAVQRSLAALKEAAVGAHAPPPRNLLAAAVVCAKARATLGEISDTLAEARPPAPAPAPPGP